MQLGEVWWANLSELTDSSPGYRRPMVVVQSDDFNRSRIQTVVVAAITSNKHLAAAPGNVAIGRRGTGLPLESVVNVSQLLTLDKRILIDRAGKLSAVKVREVQDGLRLVLAL